MNDLSTYLGVPSVNSTFRTESGREVNVTKKGDNLNLNMTDFMKLMITEMTNQGIDDTMDTSEMLNQMVQMQMIQALVDMTKATDMSYSASLVGKEVTVSKQNSDGTLEYITGTVTGSGMYNDSPIIFLDNQEEFYNVSDLMAVGRLPEKTEDKTEDQDTGSTSNHSGSETPGTSEV